MEPSLLHHMRTLPYLECAQGKNLNLQYIPTMLYVNCLALHDFR